MRSKPGASAPGKVEKEEKKMMIEERQRDIMSRTGKMTYTTEEFTEAFPQFIDTKVGVRYEIGLDCYVINMWGWHGPSGGTSRLSQAIEMFELFAIEGEVPVLE